LSCGRDGLWIGCDFRPERTASEAISAPSASRGRKSPAGEIDIGEREQREHLCAVLGDAAIAHLAIAELAFDDAEDVLDLGADFAEPAIARPLPSGELAPRLGLLLDRPQNARGFCRALPLVAGVALVAVDRRVVLADQMVHYLGIVDA